MTLKKFFFRLIDHLNVLINKTKSEPAKNNSENDLIIEQAIKNIENKFIDIHKTSSLVKTEKEVLYS